MRAKHIVQLVLVLALTSTAGFYIIFGPQGVREYFTLKKSLEHHEHEVALLKHELADLRHTIKQWKQDPFVKEKMAREDLQMSHTNEVVYFLK